MKTPSVNRKLGVTAQRKGEGARDACTHPKIDNFTTLWLALVGAPGVSSQGLR